MTTTGPPQRIDEPPEEQPGGQMPLMEHLRELRTRIFKMAIAIVIGFAIGFALHVPILGLLMEPYCQLPEGLRAGEQALATAGGFDAECTLHVFDVLGAFFLRLKAAAVVAVIVAAPVVFYQIWRFVTPGLRPVERRYALPFVLISQLLFAGGAVFSYFVLPRALEVLLGFAGDNVASVMGANEYLNFLLHMMIGFGVAFEVPLILITLVLMGSLSAAALRRFRRYAIFLGFVASAIITPTTDPITMTLLALPLIGFYELSLLVARLVERRRRKRATAA